MGRPLVAGASVLVASAGCHVVVQRETTRSAATERIQHLEGAIAHRPTLVVTEAGRLRFVEPLECPTEEIVRQHTTIELATDPNLATFTVGVIALAAGGVLLTSGLLSGEASASPYSYLGLASAGIGLPLAIGPWIGNRTELRERDGEASVVRRPGPSRPCGERPLAARDATLDAGGIEIHGEVDRDGVFSISPYAWVDAYGAPARMPAEVTARIEGDNGGRTLTAVLQAGALARHAADFLAHADFDGTVEPLRLVPGIAAGALRVSLLSGEHGPAVRVVLALRNDGPGEAFGLRGQITAPAAPAIDGRMIYVGRLAKGAAVSREIAIPLAPLAAAALRDATIELSVELRDAHGTAPSTPVRFRGSLRGEPAR